MSLTELLGFLFALAGILLAIKQIKWNWISNIISSLFYLFAFYEIQLYADAGLQILFIVMSIIGFINWNNPKYASLEAVSRLNRKEIWSYSVGFIITAVAIITITYTYTNSDVPFWDGGLTAASILTTFMAIKKKIESWLLWMLIDALYIPLYLYKSYILSSILYAIYIILAYLAYREWKKHLAHA